MYDIRSLTLEFGECEFIGSSSGVVPKDQVTICLQCSFIDRKQWIQIALVIASGTVTMFVDETLVVNETITIPLRYRISVYQQ